MSKWSKEVTNRSNALDIEPGIFTNKDPKAIAYSLKRSAELSRRRKSTVFGSAMSMLNFYINRTGKNLPPKQRIILEEAKAELRKLCHQHKMFSLPTQSELKVLAWFKEPHCVTIYLPYSKPVTTGTNPNYISLKNLVREAEDALNSFDLNTRVIKKTLRPARELLDSPALEQLSEEGVVMFLHESFSRMYIIPDGRLEPLITVEYGFNLDRLLQVIEDNKKYYLLALAHDNVRLFAGDHYSIAPVNLRNFPADMVKALRLDEYPKWSETHTIGPPHHGKGPESEAYHGQYNKKQEDKNELLQFFQMVDHRLHKFLHNKRVPLVLAGVDYLIPIYRQVNSYRYLAPKSIHGNTDHARLTELQRSAWKIVGTGAKL